MHHFDVNSSAFDAFVQKHGLSEPEIRIARLAWEEALQAAARELDAIDAAIEQYFTDYGYSNHLGAHNDDSSPG